MFVGYVQLEDTLTAPVLVLDSSRTPVNLDNLPVVRVYGPLGLVANATAMGSLLDSGTVTDATQATPVVITSANHGLSTGAYVTVQGVLGNTAANTTTTVTVVDADTFELDSTVGSGSYTSGGTWNVTGLYLYSVDCTSADGFEAGTTYYSLITGAVAGVQTADQQTFIVT